MKCEYFACRLVFVGGSIHLDGCGWDYVILWWTPKCCQFQLCQKINRAINVMKWNIKFDYIRSFFLLHSLKRLFEIEIREFGVEIGMHYWYQMHRPVKCFCHISHFNKFDVTITFGRMPIVKGARMWPQFIHGNGLHSEIVRSPSVIPSFTATIRRNIFSKIHFSKDF